MTKTLAFSHAGEADPCSAYQACKMIKSIIHVIFRPHDRAGSDFKESVIKSLGISHVGQADPSGGRGWEGGAVFGQGPSLREMLIHFSSPLFSKEKTSKTLSGVTSLLVKIVWPNH